MSYFESILYRLIYEKRLWKSIEESLYEDYSNDPEATKKVSFLRKIIKVI